MNKLLLEELFSKSSRELVDSTTFETELAELGDKLGRRQYRSIENNKAYASKGVPLVNARFLSRHFNYRAGSMANYVIRKGKRGLPIKNVVVAPTWFSVSGEVMSEDMWALCRETYVDGREEEFFPPEKQAIDHILISQHRTNFELEKRCLLLGDGELSYRCLQYLCLRHYREKKRPAANKDCREWMRVLGLIGFDSESPTYRLLRMLDWLAEPLQGNEDEPGPLSPELTSKIKEYLEAVASAWDQAGGPAPGQSTQHRLRLSLPLPEALQCSILDHIRKHIERVERESSEQVRIGFNASGHLALRCVTVPSPDVYFPKSVRRYLQKVKEAAGEQEWFDTEDTDRGMVLLCLSLIKVGDRSLLNMSFGSYLRVSGIVRQLRMEDSQETRNLWLLLYIRLNSCIALIGLAPLVERSANEMAERDKRTYADIITHDYVHKIIEAFRTLDISAARECLKEPGIVDHVRRVAISCLIQEQKLNVMLARPWLQREYQKLSPGKDIRIDWSDIEITPEDVYYWYAKYAYDAAVILYARADERLGEYRELINVHYMFKAQGLSHPLSFPDQILKPDFETLLEKFLAMDEQSVLVPWPLSEEGDAMAFAGKKAIILWAAHEMLRNAVSYVVRRVRQGHKLPSYTVLFDVTLDAARKVFHIRVENHQHVKAQGLPGSWPRVLDNIRRVPGVSIGPIDVPRRFVFDYEIFCPSPIKPAL